MRNVRTVFVAVALLLGSVLCSVTAQAKSSALSMLLPTTHAAAPSLLIVDEGSPITDPVLRAAGMIARVTGQPPLPGSPRPLSFSLPDTPPPGFPPSNAEASAPAYTILELGTGTGNTSAAWHINNRGEVLWSWGTTQDPASGRYSDTHLALWYDGTVTDLTPLGFEQVIAINDAGIVLGSERDRGLLYRPQGNIEPLRGFDQDAYPADINEAGAVTGNVQGRAEIISSDRVIEIPSPPGYGFVEPAAINASGSVAGTARLSRTDDVSQRAVLYSNGVTAVLDAAPGAPSSSAADINDEGVVVGHPGIRGVHLVPEPGRAFLYDPQTGIMTDLGVLPGYTSSMAMAINNASQVVGYALGTDQGEPPFIRAFVYDQRTETLQDLNDLIPPNSGWTLLAASDINDAGQIVGRGWIGGEIHAFLLAPSS